MTSWQIGEFILNRFEITGILRGGMGLVYVLQDRHTGKSFAAKTYLSTSEGSRAAFEREALNWIRLTPHPNVVEALFVEHLNSVPFIFLQYVNGGDLRSQITQGAMADAQKLLTSALAICSGMEHASKETLDFIYELTHVTPNIPAGEIDELRGRLFQVFGISSALIALAGLGANQDAPSTSAAVLLGVALAGYIGATVIVLLASLTVSMRRTYYTDELWGERVADPGRGHQAQHSHRCRGGVHAQREGN